MLWILNLEVPDSLPRLLVEAEGIPSASWAPGGEAVYYVIRDEGRRMRELWKMGVEESSGTSVAGARQLLDEIGVDFDLSLDGRRLVFARSTSSLNLSLISATGLDNSPWAETPLTTGTGLAMSPSVSPNEKWLAYTWTSSGSRNLYKVSLEDGDPAPLTFYDDREALRPSWSIDGASILFLLDSSESQSLWQIDSGGGTPRELLRLENEYDRIQVVSRTQVMGRATDRRRLILIDLESGEEERLIQSDRGFADFVAAAGQREVAVWSSSGEREGLSVLSLDTRDRRQVVGWPGRGDPLAWSDDGDSVIGYGPTRVASRWDLFSHPVNGGQTQILIEDLGRLLGDEGYPRAVAGDASAIIVERGESRSDVWLVENFDPDP